FPQKGESLHDVTEGLVRFFNGMLDWGHPKMGMNVIPPSTLPSIAANLMAAVFSPNLIEGEYSVNVATAEIEVTGMCADLAGFDPEKAGGIFTFGGLGTWLYALKIGITKALGKDSRFKGIREDAQIICSEVSHFSKLNSSDWLGVGMNNVRRVGINEDNSMNLEHLREILEDSHRQGKPIGMICGTTGTTDAFGVDDIKGIVEIRDEFVKNHHLEYTPHVHADSVIGWAWLVYKDYDFETNPMELSDGLKEDIKDVSDKFQNLHMADSMGIDFHKTGYTPYISSLFLLKDSEDFDLIHRPPEDEAYLFHFGTYNPGEYSLESSRSAAGALAAWANLKLFGIEGFQAILARLVEAERILRKKIESSPDMLVVNPDDHGFVTLYRIYPPGTEPHDMYARELNGTEDEKLRQHNTYLYDVSSEINRLQREENGPFLSYTSNHKLNKNSQPIAALKVYPMSPFVTEEAIDMIMDGINKAKRNVDEKRS
ncbi:pyridoxal phosphate-dependent decarboxylase family protein, partial [Acidobacteriota bacterium]